MVSRPWARIQYQLSVTQTGSSHWVTSWGDGATNSAHHPMGTCYSQPHSAASLIYFLALQHSPKWSSQPILQESCKFACGTHQLSAYIPMSFHICEYSLSRGVAPNPPLWDIWAWAYSAFCSGNVQMDMFLFLPSFTDTASLLKEMYFSHTEEIFQPQQKWSEMNEMEQASEVNWLLCSISTQVFLK